MTIREMKENNDVRMVGSLSPAYGDKLIYTLGTRKWIFSRKDLFYNDKEMTEIK